MTIDIKSDKILIRLFGIRNISKDDRALINVSRQDKNWSLQRLLRVFRAGLGLDKRGTAAEEN